MHKDDFRRFSEHPVFNGPVTFNQSTHDHQYNKKGECSCGKVLPDDIRQYPSIGIAGTVWTG